MSFSDMPFAYKCLASSMVLLHVHFVNWGVGVSLSEVPVATGARLAGTRMAPQPFEERPPSSFDLPPSSPP